MAFGRLTESAIPDNWRPHPSTFDAMDQILELDCALRLLRGSGGRDISRAYVLALLPRCSSRVSALFVELALGLGIKLTDIILCGPLWLLD